MKQRARTEAAKQPQAEAASGGRQRKKRKNKKEDEAKYNSADPESRIMRTRSKPFEQCYCAQAAVDADSQIIMAPELTNEACDAPHLVAAVDHEVRARYKLRQWTVEPVFGGQSKWDRSLHQFAIVCRCWGLRPLRTEEVPKREVELMPKAMATSAPLFPVEEAVVMALEEAAVECWSRGSGKGQWTTTICTKLVDLGQRKPWAFHAGCRSVPSARWPEWLCDVMWYRERKTEDNENDLVTDSIALACESELDDRPWEQQSDFQKLIFIICDYRLMIIRYHDENETKERFDAMKNLCPGSRGHRYLLVGVGIEESLGIVYEAFTL